MSIAYSRSLFDLYCIISMFGMQTAGFQTGILAPPAPSTEGHEGCMFPSTPSQGTLLIFRSL